REFDALVLVTEADDPTPPCGQCRQVLVEFAPDLAITSRTRAGAERRWRLSELLPHPFNPSSLTQR
ncbi:MAG: Cytidine deaminase, partial [uncultured Gemmatimonadaceae bacterium]